MAGTPAGTSQDTSRDTRGPTEEEQEEQEQEEQEQPERMTRVRRKEIPTQLRMHVTHDTKTEHDFPSGGSIRGLAPPTSDHNRL